MKQPEKLRNATFSAEQIARLCHQVNKAYCELLGDNSQPDWENAPDWQKFSIIQGVKFHLENPGAGPEASHNSWLEVKLSEGWAYGPVKDPEKREHPCFVPFDELPHEQQIKDVLFKNTVEAMRCMTG